MRQGSTRTCLSRSTTTSTSCSRQAIKELIAARQALGWTFAFLGAGPDAYAEAGGMGYDERSVQAYRADGAGTSAAFASVTRALGTKRQRRLTGEDVDPADFFEGVKEAEADREESSA